MYKVKAIITFKRALKGSEWVKLECCNKHFKTKRELNKFMSSNDCENYFSNYIYEPLQKK